VPVPTNIGGGSVSENVSNVDAFDMLSAADQAAIQREESLISSFLETLRSQIETVSKDLQAYRQVRKTFKPPKPLWPYSDDDPEVIRLREEEQRRKKEEEDRKKREEEERKAAEALAEQQKAAAGAKGKAPAAPAKGA
jgi:hypothetical protein